MVANGVFTVTAFHVVAGASSLTVAGLGPPKWASSAVVAASDESQDIAVLRLEQPGPMALTLAPESLPSASTPLICWEDAGEPAAGPSVETFRMVLVGCLSLGAIHLLSEGGRERIALAGRLRHGMSGGPLVDPRSSRVVGVLAAKAAYDPTSVVESWASHSPDIEAFSSEAGDDVQALILAQLACGGGIAVPAAVPARLLRALVGQTG